MFNPAPLAMRYCFADVRGYSRWVLFYAPIQKIFLRIGSDEEPRFALDKYLDTINYHFELGLFRLQVLNNFMQRKNAPIKIIPLSLYT